MGSDNLILHKPLSIFGANKCSHQWKCMIVHQAILANETKLTYMDDLLMFFSKINSAACKKNNCDERLNEFDFEICQKSCYICINKASIQYDTSCPGRNS